MVKKLSPMFVTLVLSYMWLPWIYCKYAMHGDATITLGCIMWSYCKYAMHGDVTITLGCIMWSYCKYAMHGDVTITLGCIMWSYCKYAMHGDVTITLGCIMWSYCKYAMHGDATITLGCIMWHYSKCSRGLLASCLFLTHHDQTLFLHLTPINYCGRIVSVYGTQCHNRSVFVVEMI